jgi:hypothetical protein
MVLTIGEGGAAGAGRTPGPAGVVRTRPGPSATRVVARRLSLAGEAGSQVLEFAMVLPSFGVALALLAQTGLLLGDVLVVHGIAREAARTLAVEGDIAEGDLADRIADAREVRLDVERTDGLVEVRAELVTRAFASAGVDLWLPARATFRDEVATGG